MTFDKDLKEAALGTDENPTAAGYLYKGARGAIDPVLHGISEARDIATSAVAGVPKQPYATTIRAAFYPEESEIDKLNADEKRRSTLREAGYPQEEIERKVDAPSEIEKTLVTKGISAASDPGQLAFMAGGPIGTAAGALLAPEMISGGGEEIGKGISDIESGDTEKGLGKIAGGAFDVGMGGLGLKHPIERAGGIAAEEFPSVNRPASEFLPEVGLPSGERGAIDISPEGLRKLNSFEDSQFRKYGKEWRSKQSPEESAYHSALLKDAPTVPEVSPPVGEGPPLPAEPLPEETIPTVEPLPEETTLARLAREDVPPITDPNVLGGPLAERRVPTEDYFEQLAKRPSPLEVEPLPEEISPEVEKPPTLEETTNADIERVATPETIDRISELVKEGYHPDRAARIARAEMKEEALLSEGREAELTAEDLETLMAKDVAAGEGIPAEMPPTETIEVAPPGVEPLPPPEVSAPPEFPPGTKFGRKGPILPPEAKPPAEVIPEAEAAPLESYKIKLSNGETYRTRARSEAEALDKINKRLTEMGVDITAEEAVKAPTRLEQLVQPVSPSRERGMIETSKAIEKAKTAEELRAGKLGERERLKAEREKQRRLEAPQRFEVELSNGKKVTISAKDYAEAAAKVEMSRKGQPNAPAVVSIKQARTPLERALAPEEKAPQQEAPTTERGLVDIATDIPKTLRSAFDVSFPARQGLFLLNRKAGRAGVAKGFKSVFESSHLEVKNDLATRPNAKLYEQFGLEQVKYDPDVTSARPEEMPATEFAEKVPGVKQSERVFIDQGNLMRANMFDMFTEKFTAEGKTPETRPDLYHGIAKYLNVLTGRDTIGGGKSKFSQQMGKASYIANKLLFSPRFIWSRVQLLNPLFYKRLPVELRKEAIRDVGGTIGGLSLLLGATVTAARAAGVDEKDLKVETDPRSTGFGKLRIGTVSYDLFSSLLPLVRTAARVTTGTKVTPSGEYQLKGLSGRSLLGIESDLPPAPFGGSTGSELLTLGESKLSPIVSAAKGLATGKGFAGEEYGVPEAFRDVAFPISATEFVQALRDYDLETAAMTMPGLLGAGVQVDIPPQRRASSISGSKTGTPLGSIGGGGRRKKSKFAF
jgi:hypothetical protein